VILDISGDKLSFGAQNDDVTRLHQAMRELGRDVPPDERRGRFFGAGTTAVVKALQAELELVSTGIVDDATVRAINGLLDRRAGAPRVVRGTVREADGRPFAVGHVQLFAQGVDRERSVGTSRLDAADGSYAIRYELPASDGGGADLRVAVFDDRGLVETTPSGDSILPDAGLIEVVEFALAGEDHRPRTEFELLSDDLSSRLGARPLAELTEDAERREVSVLAARADVPPDRVAPVVRAHKLAQGGNLPAAAFYGLLQEGLPADEAALLATDPGERLRALQGAIDAGAVPEEIDGKPLTSFLDDFMPSVAGQFQGLFSGILDPGELETFVGRYVRERRGPDAFWQAVETDPAFADRAAELKLTAQLAALTNKHEPLVAAVHARPDIGQVSDLARLTADGWKSLIGAPGVGVPADTPGATPEEQVDNYAAAILEQVEAAFPTRFFAARLGDGPVAQFLEDQPSYDLKTTYLARFFGEHPEAAASLDDVGRRQLEGFQRIHRLTGNAEETLALSARGFDSAKQIARLDRSVFAERHRDILSGARAVALHAKAQHATAAALALFGEYAADLNRTGMAALPTLDGSQLADAAQETIPDWESLFGSFDLCACDECASVHSPAAYLVDVLQFLADRDAKAPLFERRPDLGEVELSCENTSTPVPVIDLVNEVLENAVAPPPPFAPLTLDPALEADLDRGEVSPALAAAFAPPLHGGASVEVLEPGVRWRVWDEAFAYAVAKEGTELQLVARSRTTRGPAARRRAERQYLNRVAYEELAQSVHPWNLPFDLSREEATLFLQQLGVTRRELMEALGPLREEPAERVVALAAERLGLSDAEYRLLVGKALDPPHAPEHAWGVASFDDITDVRDVLERSGLSGAELDSLLATWFVNPTGAVRVVPAPDAPPDTCDPTRLRVDGLTPDVLDRLHRLVRLWRTLGWAIPEVDLVVRGLGADAAVPSLTDDLLVALDALRELGSRLGLGVRETLALWRPIDTAGPDSLYRRLFLDTPNAAQGEAFRLEAGGEELAQPGVPLRDRAAALQAAFRLNAADLATLIALTDGTSTLANLSVLYRHATLARQLGLPVSQLLTVIELSREQPGPPALPGLDPFQSDRPQDALRFVDAVRTIQRSTFDVPALDYLVRGRAAPASALVPAEAALTGTLTEIRSALAAVPGDDADPVAVRLGIVAERVASALDLPANIVHPALLRQRTTADPTALDVFLALDDIGDEVVSRANVAAQYALLERLLQVAALVETLPLPESRLDWLLSEHDWLLRPPDPSVPVPFEAWLALVELQQLRRRLALEDAATEAVLGALAAVKTAGDQPARRDAKRALVEALERWAGWSLADVVTLIGAPGDLADRGLLEARCPEDYQTGLLVRLDRALALVKRLRTTVMRAHEWCGTEVRPSDAEAIRAAARAGSDEGSWWKVARPIHDTLRERQRDALLGYLVARPAAWRPAPQPETEPADARALYGHFLIDVEMSACQLTSRVKQALASAQLFAQRCLLGREREVTTGDPKWAQWAWMKSYRTWEANRKIWLYPENWIEPQLRDDKTPFFTELENELLQSELDEATAERALMGYLEKLDQVARLELVGVFEDDTRTLHVVGRTFHKPHVHYYRRREGSTGAWAPWERMDADIEGDHLIPVLWNGKLMVIWPVFTEKTRQKPVTMPQPGGTLQGGDPYWEIQLAWSERASGRWTGKTLSEPVAFTAHQGENDVLFGPYVRAPGGTTKFAMAMIRDTDHEPANGDGDGGDGGGGSGGSGGDPPSPPHSQPSSAPRRLVAKERFSFKAFVSGDELAVRGFLRRDYRQSPAPDDAAIACCFGEFRFLGCRKIVVTAHRGRIEDLHFPLAPTATEFDHMWFSGTHGRLSLMDGAFPSVRPPLPGESAAPDISNEFESIAGDPAFTVAGKHTNPVLASTPAPFRLLPPHQDRQLVGDRPFFFMDDRSAFVVTSRVVRPMVAWTAGDLGIAWRDNYFPPSGSDSPAPAAPPLAPFTVLATGPDGRRIARQLDPVSLAVPSHQATLVPKFLTSRSYQFVDFHHPYLCELVKALGRGGIPELLSLATQRRGDPDSFARYQPTSAVDLPYPADEVSFAPDSAYGAYNWELFFHVPLLIADQLSKNQRFAEAQRWFHFIFDPTGAPGGDPPQRFWHTRPFHERLAPGYAAESIKAIEELVAKGSSPAWDTAVARWRSDPFSPHLVARLRTTAYQKSVVMKYIDNLIAWGDQLFRRETLESINEATQLYVLAAEILGRRPEVIRRKHRPTMRTPNTLDEVGPLGNALELLFASTGDASPGPDDPSLPDLPSARTLFFCIPENDKLLGYWQTVGDRLFKIRHCMDIEGRVRELPLFPPPIDPALLVRAKAAGLDIDSVLADLSPPEPSYRFVVMLQKASDMVAEVRNLGGALLSALERKDAEQLAGLRSGQELRLLQMMRDTRVRQVDEAEANLAALRHSRELAAARKAFYESRQSVSPLELLSLGLTAASQVPLGTKATSDALSVAVYLVPDAKAGAPPTLGFQFGGSNKGSSSEAHGRMQETNAAMLNIASMGVTRMGEYARRRDDWGLQAQLATIELEQIDQQLAAAETRLAITQHELRSHERQIEDSRAVDEVMRGKFTNHDLHQWTVGQLSGLYFQAYQLAYDLAKRAERCLEHELGRPYGDTGIIRYGSWVSLRKGLLAGDHLAGDLKRLDAAYLDGNTREYELTKHVSVTALEPRALLELKETGSCEFKVPEWLFDLDTPGHYQRRLETVSLTIPCVTGPYQGVHLTLRLLKNSYRRTTDLNGGYARGEDETANGPGDRFVDDRKVIGSIVTSSGQNDSGLFEPSMRDERYLPFEGAGAVSTWRLELPTEFPTLDYQTISDVVLHLRYTAKDGGEEIREAARDAVKAHFGDTANAHLGDTANSPLVRLFSLRHEFPAEWHRFVTTPADPTANVTATVDLSVERFPYFTHGQQLTIRGAKVIARGTPGTAPAVAIAPGTAAPDLAHPIWEGAEPPGVWTIGTADPHSLTDLFVIVVYTIQRPVPDPNG
jgi:Tc toxin complex TcA C-terminal TcB-binding domain/Neuraminidase-like domain/Salmonella virulence plasmid 28.1kDa A protein/Putative peptidoglycan binding domain